MPASFDGRLTHSPTHPPTHPPTHFPTTGTDRIPSRKQRFSVIHEGIPRRRLPASFDGRRSERVCFCDRILTDEVLDENACRHVVVAVEVGRSGGWVGGWVGNSMN